MHISESSPAAPASVSSNRVAGNAFVEISGLTKKYEGTTVLDGVDYSQRKGTTTAIIGPSGSGKSTFLRCLNLLETPTSGHMRIGSDTMFFEKGKAAHKSINIARFREKIGMVFQTFELFPHMSVLQNVTIGPTSVKGMPKAAAAELAMRILHRVGLGGKTASYPRQLSGGQCQRVAIARALAMEPGLLLFDEATSALDPELVGEVLEVIRDLAVEGRTMILVTHELEFAYEVADMVFFLADGHVVEAGPPNEILVNPRTERLRDFLGKFSKQNALKA